MINTTSSRGRARSPLGKMSNEPRSHRFEKLVRDHARLISSAVRRVCGSDHRSLVPDIEQEVHLALWQRLASGPAIEHPVAYLYKMARTTAVRALRRHRATAEVPVDDPASYEKPSVNDDALEQRDRRLLLGQLLERLEPEQTRALRAYLAGASHREVAADEGWSESVARHRIYRGIASLQKLGRELLALVLLAMLWPWSHAPDHGAVPGRSTDRAAEPGVIGSEPIRGTDETAITPAPGARLALPPTELRWPTEEGALRYRPVLLDATGAEHWRGEWVESPHQVVPQPVRQMLSPGRWLWTVEVEGEVARPRLGPWLFEITGGEDFGSTGDGAATLRRSLDRAREAATERRFELAVELLERALGEAANAPPELAYQLAAELGEVHFAAQDFASAEAAYHRAARLGRLADRGGLPLARHHTDLGVVALARGDLDTAEREHGHALALRRALAPESREVAVSLNNLGVVAHYRGDAQEAERLWLEAAELFERSTPDVLAAAKLLVNLGAAAFTRGELELAEERWRRALALREQALGESLEVAAVHNNLALVHAERGELEAADRHHARALELRLRLAPESQATARSLHNTSSVARRRGDHARALVLARRAAELRLRLAPRHLETAQSFLALGRLAMEADRLEEARQNFERGLAILAYAQPDGGLDTAIARIDLGRVEAAASSATVARRHYETALSWLAEHAPDSLFEARARRALAGLALDRPESRSSDWVEEVRSHLERAESIARRRAPESGALAWALGLRSRLARKLDRPAEARALGLEGLAVLDRQERLWGGDEDDRMRFADRFADLYLEVARAYLPGDSAAAFEVLERYRARRIRALLAERRSTTAAAASGPRIPPPASAAELAAALPERGVLIAYLVGETSTLALTLDRAGEPRGVELPLGRRELGERVRRFVDLAQSPGLGREGLVALGQQGRALYDLLLAPFAAELATAEHWILVPDGPLDALPWAALSAGGSADDPRWLVEERPLSVVLSGSVETVLDRPRSATGPWLLLGAIDGDEERSELPGSAWELERIAQRVEGAVVRRGRAANEATVHRLGPEARVLHFALHGVLDASSPFDSHLLLAPREDLADEGRLDAWEIMTGLELEAELVTLSACESRGLSTRGSGPLGLVTAFHLAGARSVLASHWRVADRPTAVLMDHFVAGLELGLPRDEALRRAQLALLEQPIALPTEPRSPSWWERSLAQLGLAGEGAETATEPFDARHPYYWAAFQLSGGGAEPLSGG